MTHPLVLSVDALDTAAGDSLDAASQAESGERLANPRRAYEPDEQRHLLANCFAERKLPITLLHGEPP